MTYTARLKVFCDNKDILSKLSLDQVKFFLYTLRETNEYRLAKRNLMR